MGLPPQKFRNLPPKAQAKKCADLLRVIILRLGKDWLSAAQLYNEMVHWLRKPEFLINPQQLQLNILKDFYFHWRSLAGLGPERDVLLGLSDGDREKAINPPLTWDVLAHNLRSAHNVGAILRTMDCLGWGILHCSGYTAHLEHKALRSAARGAEQWMPVQRWDSPLDCIAGAQKAGQSVVALELTPDAQVLEDFAWPEQGLLLLGNEELGVAPKILERCDAKIYIPMHGRKNSLNVASAFAIVAHFVRNFDL